MTQNFNEFLAFESAQIAKGVEVTGIQVPDSNYDYSTLSYDEQKRQFLQQAGGDATIEQEIQVKVQRITQDGLPNIASDWLAPDAVDNYIGFSTGQLS